MTLLYLLNCLPTVHGPITYDLGVNASLIEVSDDGNLLLMAFSLTKSPEVYENNGHGFIFKESLNSCLGHDLELSKSGELIAC